MNQTGQSCNTRETRESDRTLMTLRSLRVIVLFLAVAVPLQLVVPAAAQQVTEASTAAPVADNQDNMIDAPSATLKPSADKAQQSLIAQPHDGEPVAQDSVPQDPSAQNQAPQRPESQPTGQTTPPPAQTPQGAAAAQVQPATGTAASKPGGAALAPPKQRRVRSFLIKFGAIAGAGVVLGTVYALSAASPSKPPGTH
jgi:cytoskeletal protein RodZ